MLQKGHFSYQKYHIAKMASHKYIIGVLKYYRFNTLLIETTPTIRHRTVTRVSLWSGKNSTLKSTDHESESYNKFRNFLLKSFSSIIGKCNLWAFFCKVCHFCKATVFVGVRFVYLWWSICLVPFFTSSLKRD